jgi:SAM-dependent methyltransferase
MVDRTRARSLAQEAVANGRPVEWFETLYREAAGGTAVVPWADRVPNPHLVEWLDEQSVHKGRALDVGSGLGDNAEELSRRGYTVTAFDVSPTAVDQAKARFPQSSVVYLAADLLDPPAEWEGRFDLVAETYTLQVLPPGARARAVESLRKLIVPGGTLLVIARGRDEHEPEGSMPWPLTVREVRDVAGDELVLAKLEDFLDHEDPPVRRLRATFTKR